MARFRDVVSRMSNNSDACFLCQHSCSRKVCFQCTCRAHPLCWKNFQTQASAENCPVCKSDNIVKPYQTRSRDCSDARVLDYVEQLTKLPAESVYNYLADKIRELLISLRTDSSRETKLQWVETIMCWVLAGSKHGGSANLLQRRNFSVALQDRLIHLYRTDQWLAAADWYRVFYQGNDIDHASVSLQVQHVQRLR